MRLCGKRYEDEADALAHAGLGMRAEECWDTTQCKGWHVRPVPGHAPAAASAFLRGPSARRRRETGPSAAVRRLIFARADGRCENCFRVVGDGWYSVQHRVARGLGGTSRDEANALWNLLLLCGSATSPNGCHLLCERRDAEMHDRGMWLWSWEDPRVTPVRLFNPAGPRITAWLTENGLYGFEPPAGAGAPCGSCHGDPPEGLECARCGAEGLR
jgi:hypothetical protein